METWAKDPEKDLEDQEKEEAEKEVRQENDDPEERMRVLAMDEYKDGEYKGETNV